MKQLNYFDHFTLRNSTFDIDIFNSYLKTDTVIYSIVDAPYVNIGKVWIKCIKKLDVDFFVVCCDEESFSQLKDLCNCLLIKADRYIDNNYYIEYQPHRKYYPEACLKTNREMYATFLKYFVSIEILKTNRNVIFSDIDCLWNKDPTEYLNNLDCDFAFQSGTHPKKYKSIFGDCNMHWVHVYET